MTQIYQSKKSIEDFKSNLANGGVRPTMFEVQIVFPKSIISNFPKVNTEQAFSNDEGGKSASSPAELTEKSTFLVKASSLPGSNIGMIPVPFRGRKLKVAGDRSFNDWQTTITNDSDYRLRDAIEKWAETIQYHNFALGHNQTTDGVFYANDDGDQGGYMGSGIVRQLDRQGKQLKVYKFAGIWPVTIDDIQLGFDQFDTIEEYGVTWAVQYWHAGDRENENGPTNTSYKNPANTERKIIS